MAVTSIQGITTTSGSGDLEIRGNSLVGVGVPAVVPITNETWFYQNSSNGDLYRWNGTTLQWVIIASGTGDIGAIPLVDPAVADNLAIQAADGSLVDAGTQIVLEQDPLQPTAARNRLATGAAPNTLGFEAVDLQGFRTEPTQVCSGNNSFSSGSANTSGGELSYTHGTDCEALAELSHASGRQAKAIHDGTYVRSDTQDQDFPTIIADEYAVRARGGVRLVTATDAGGVPTKTTTLDTGGVWRLNDDTSRTNTRREILAADQRPAQADIAGTTHTFALSNENQIVASQSGSATTFTIPLNSVAAFAIGSIIGIEQQGAGVLSVEATAGVTLNGVDGATIALTAQWGAAALRKIATNSWIIIGAI